MGKRFASLYRCLAFARFWKVKFWRSFIKCQYFNDGWTDFHKIYIFISLSWAFFENRKNSGLTPGHNDDPVTQWPGRERWPKWPIDPVTQWPSSMSGHDIPTYYFVLIGSWQSKLGRIVRELQFVRRECSRCLRMLRTRVQFSWVHVMWTRHNAFVIFAFLGS